MKLAQLSRTVAHALRHEPWLYELEMDESGWVPTQQLLAALRSIGPQWRGLSEEDLSAMIEASDKRRYELGNGRIRALYGHSLPGKLRVQRATPPARLYHGSGPEAAEAIRTEGLLPMGRQYVHLSVDVATALQVGGRKSAEPVVLLVDAEAAHAAGHAFYRGNEQVWLADAVPAFFIGQSDAFR